MNKVICTFKDKSLCYVQCHDRTHINSNILSTHYKYIIYTVNLFMPDQNHYHKRLEQNNN